MTLCTHRPCVYIAADGHFLDIVVAVAAAVVAGVWKRQKRALFYGPTFTVLAVMFRKDAGKGR